MGIPHLTRHLLPYAQSASFNGRDGASHIQSVAIDGPSLVYHVYSRLLSCSKPNLDLMEAQPTCNEVSLGVMLYLLQLTILGVEIKKICFDGALPTVKRKTRLERLERTRKKLELLYSVTQRGYRSTHRTKYDGTIDCEKVMRNRSLSPKYSGLPENPFMVSAVFEDLRHRWSKEKVKQVAGDVMCLPPIGMEEFPWANISVMVPREADVECARISKLTGCAVLTNDSDLLLCDLGSHGSVVFLNSVDLVEWDSTKPAESEVKALRLSPALLAPRVGIEDIRHFAYQLKNHPHLGLAELIRLSKCHIGATRTADYSLFVNEDQFTLDQFKEDASQLISQQLDPRVSEVFCQYAFRDVYLQGPDPQMYLAILNEDPTRRCAWEGGRSYRRLAYSILNSWFSDSERSASIDEHVRRGQRIAIDTMTLGDKAWIITEIKAIYERLTEVKAAIDGDFKSLNFWVTFALYELYSGTATNLPDARQLSHFLDQGHMGARLSWADVHFFAQIQSVLYSLRVLQQLLSLTTSTGNLVPESISILAGLPPLHVMMGSRREVIRKLRNHHPVHDFVDKFFRLLDHTPQDLDAASEPYSADENANVASQPHSEGRQKSASNIFELLACD